MIADDIQHHPDPDRDRRKEEWATLVNIYPILPFLGAESMSPGKPESINVGKVATVTALLSMSGLAAYNALTSLEHSTKDNESAAPPNQEAQKAEPATTPKTKSAIAQPEKLPPVTVAKTPAKPIQPAKSSAESKSEAVARTALARFRTLQDAASFGRLPAVPSAIAPTATVSNRHDEEQAAIAPLNTSLRDIDGHWAQYQIDQLTERRIIQGFPDDSFRPDQAITAQEFATLMQKAFPDGQQPVTYGDLQARSSHPVTRADAAAMIYRNLVQREPQMIVTHVKIQGEVVRPGGYSLAAASDPRIGLGRNLPTVSRAIQQAGGSLDTANLRQVEIHRTTDIGTQKVIKVNVSNNAQGGDRSDDFVLQQDDQLVVLPAPSSAQRPIESPSPP